MREHDDLPTAYAAVPRAVAYVTGTGVLLLALAIVGFTGPWRDAAQRVNQKGAKASPASSELGMRQFSSPDQVLARDERLPQGADDHLPLKLVLDYPGITNPMLHQPEEADLPPETPVIGIRVEDQACAFVPRDMTGPTRHIVNMSISGTSVSVTYCDLVDCVRVLTLPEEDDPIDLRVGGLDAANQMVYLYQGVRYGQLSKELPLVDFPHERTTLGEWMAQHPETLVYTQRSSPASW